MWTGCLGELPIADPAIPYDGTVQFRNGQLDSCLGLASIFGHNGHGQIGYSCDQWRGFKTFADAHDSMMEFLNPLFPESVSVADREAVAKQLFMQRTRKHYQDDIPIPDPEPEPDPQPVPLTLNSVSISGGTPPYTVTVEDGAGNNIQVEVP